MSSILVRRSPGTRFRASKHYHIKVPGQRSINGTTIMLLQLLLLLDIKQASSLGNFKLHLVP